MPTAFLTDYVTLPLAALWTGQFVRAGYRLLAYRCRLTSTQFARFRGPLYPRDEPLELSQIGRVEVRRTILQIVLGVGDVIVTPEESSGRSPLGVSGVRGPKKFAALIESTVAAAREGKVSAARSPRPTATRS